MGALQEIRSQFSGDAREEKGRYSHMNGWFFMVNVGKYTILKNMCICIYIYIWPNGIIFHLHLVFNETRVPPFKKATKILVVGPEVPIIWPDSCDSWWNALVVTYCWWKKSGWPVEVGSFSHYLQGFIMFYTSQVVQHLLHQQYHSLQYIIFQIYHINY